MKKGLLLFASLFGISLVSAQVPTVDLSIGAGNTFAIAGLIIALILVLIYWILQSRLSGP